MLTLCLLFLCIRFVAQTAADEKPATSREASGQSDETLSYTAGKVRYESDFSKDDLDRAPWQAQHGNWSIRDGKLVGVTGADDKHEASLSLMLEVPENQLVSLDFSLAPDETFSLCFIGGPGPHGKVVVTSREFYLWMKAGDTGEARIIDYVPLKLAAQTWHSFTFIRNGDRLVASIDGKQRIAGIHEKFTSPKKRINLCADTAKTKFDNISVSGLSEFKAAKEIFSRPSYTQKEFWAMREAKYGLVRSVKPKK